MRINVKHLSYYASSFKDSGSVDMEGWLWKKGEVNTSYQKRWCVLKGNLFFYFEKRNDREPYGMIVLENCIVQLAEGGDSPFTFSIHFTGEGTRIYKLTADNDQACTKWIKALSSCSYKYLKILVEGLERELDEILQESNEEESSRKMLNSCSKVMNLTFKHETEINFKENYFGTLSVKSSSLSNILDLSEDDDSADFLTFDVFAPNQQKSTKKLARSKSSSELVKSNTSLSRDVQLPLKFSSPKVKSSVLKKIGRGRKKNQTVKIPKSDVVEETRSNTDANFITFKFLELHEKFRQDIIALVDT